MDSPVGKLFLAGTEDGLTELRFADRLNADLLRGNHPGADGPDRSAPFREVIRQLEAYFKGKRRVFDVPMTPKGTPFQESVWKALQGIPYGVTISYKELAERVGRPGACRAVGAANGLNPISILIPCHRVIGSSGRLTGYGGGLDVKRVLLELEGAIEPVKPAH